MGLTRRKFLKLAGVGSLAAAVLAACRPASREFVIQAPARLPEDLVSGVDNWYATLSGEDGANTGVIVRIVEGRAKKIEGNPDYPMNEGKLSARGQAGVQAVYHPDRIRRPMRATGPRGSGQYAEITWSEALDELAGQLRPLVTGGRGDSIVLATEPMTGHLPMVASRFAQSLGGATYAQFEPLDLNALSTATYDCFGSDLLPEFDIQKANYLLSFGADFLMGWIAQVRHNRQYGEFRQGEGRERGTFVHVDSRFSGTAANADQWVPIRPGHEGKLALSIAHVIVRDRLGDSSAARALYGPDPLATLAEYSPGNVSTPTGVSADRIEEIAHGFAEHQPALAIGGGSAGAHTNGRSSLAAIFSLNFLVGSVGKPGGIVLNPASPLGDGPLFKGTAGFSSYAALPFSKWRALVDKMQQGAVSALLVHNADLVHGLPKVASVESALEQVPFVASFSSFLDDTTAMADLILPAHLPLEDWSDGAPNPGPGHQIVGFGQPVIRPFHDTRGLGDILLMVGHELGLDPPWTEFREVLREAAQKLQQLNRGSVEGASFEAYWNDLLRQGGWWDANARSNAKVAAPRIKLDQAEPEFSGSATEYPYNLVLFPGIGIGDGRLANLPWMQATPDPITTAAWATWVELNSRDANERGLKEGSVVHIESVNGTVEAPVYPNPALPRGVVAMPIGQGHRFFGRYANGRGVNPLSLLAPLTDSDTGSLAWAATRVRISGAGARVRIPKFEGAVLPVDYDGKVQVTRG